ncbi:MULTISPECIES: antibiotic biosynthesis monooxygenase [Cobetia]|uniref:putative quinol monooxygenase n=1 Tax=Cobetia TaxID=204286 RepID=UPI001CDA9C6D|nr:MULTISPECIES: antibiotic biosynthesis monooxygenase [Cobetia]MDH2293507.1 antibiotic biosynthesis monooxygenase [Cobetia sp. 1AS1]MDH2298366.1 antibiotic biosynthesis monooxygenase [Cobetia sp. 29-18-1]UBU50000.1 antibiotic biosynthesis monooxygenase [Cobetia amphilecti]
MLTLIVKFDVKPEQLATFKQALADNKLGSAAEPGMLEMRFFAAKDSPTAIHACELNQAAVMKSCSVSGT